MEWFFKLYMLSYLLITIGATMQDKRGAGFYDKFIDQLWNVGKWYLIGLVVILIFTFVI